MLVVSRDGSRHVVDAVLLAEASLLANQAQAFEVDRQAGTHHCTRASLPREAPIPADRVASSFRQHPLEIRTARSSRHSFPSSGAISRSRRMQSGTETPFSS